jgi:hypothetical protein
MFTTLADCIDIADAIITADAMHAQRAHAHYLVERRAHYVLTVNRNQPHLHTLLAALPWRDVPSPTTPATVATAGPSGAP